LEPGLRPHNCKEYEIMMSILALTEKIGDRQQTSANISAHGVNSVAASG
jgi:hypothetical protein